jgi:SAM-dependent methyltransferase
MPSRPRTAARPDAGDGAATQKGDGDGPAAALAGSAPDPAGRREQASATGGRTLEIFAHTPQLNRWIYSRFAACIHGDVLEIGSGIGNLSAHIVEDAARAVLTDVEPPYLERLQATFADGDRVQVARFDLDGDVPEVVAGRTFDAIIAVNVIEHIHDDRRAVAMLASLLKPGGRLLVYVPAVPVAYGPLDVMLGHYRRYSAASLDVLLRGAGLDPGPIRYFNLPGLIGWLVAGRVLRRTRLDPRQLAIFERLVPLLRVEDRVRLPFGLGVISCATKLG